MYFKKLLIVLTDSTLNYLFLKSINKYNIMLGT